MPLGPWKDFDACVAHMMRPKEEGGQGYDEETAKATCGKIKATVEEGFSWAGSIKEMPGVDNLIRGKALHPLRTVHPEQWPQVREYLEEELEKSAHTLAGKPLLLDHYQVLHGQVLGAEYEDGAIEYVAQLNDQGVMELIRNGAIKHVSVEFEFKSLEQVNGFAPRGINFTGLSLLRLFQPGDPLSTVELVEVWEGIIKQLKEAKMKEQAGAEPSEFIFYLVRDPAAFLEERFSTVWVDQTNGIQGVYGYLREQSDSPQPMALLFMKANNWTLQKMAEWLQAHPQYVRQTQPQAGSPTAIGIQPAQPGPSQTIGVESLNEEELKRFVEAQVKAILKEQEDEEGEREKLRKAAEERAEKYSIGVKEGGHLTKPDEFKDIPEDQFADPVNYRYPVDKEHAAAALKYFNQPDNRQAGGYSHEEAVKVMERIIRGCLSAEVEVAYQPEDPVYRDLPEELKTKLKGYEKKEGKEGTQSTLTRPTLGEALISPSTSEPPTLVVPVEKLEAIMPSIQAERSMSFGAQRFVQDVRRLIREAKEDSTSG